MNGTDNASARESLRTARDMFYDAFREKFSSDADCREFVRSFILTQGEIRLEVELNATNNIFTFGTTVQQPNTNNIVFNTEQRLPMQDSICVTEAFLYVCKPASQTSTAHRLRSYGNIVDFSAAAALSLDTTFYSHGSLTAKVNNRVLIPYRGLDNFYYRPMTQQTAALGAASPGDQLRPVEDGGVTLEPNLVLIGSAASIIQIQLPSALATVDAFTRAVLILKGPYAQNSTVVN